MAHEFPTPKPDKPPLRDKIVSQIPVELFIERFRVREPRVQEALRAYPILCYLLGNVTADPQTRDVRPDGVERPVYFLTEGSGMFGLEYPQDALRWRGIFNHIMGTARQAYFLANILRSLTPVQKQQFADLGFNFDSFEDLDPELLRDFMFISHAGRRQVDEKVWHNLDDTVHRHTDSGQATVALLQKYQADPLFVNLMRVENHTEHLQKIGQDGKFIRLDDNILTYCDWTFGQEPNTLQERFKGLRRSQRASREILDILERCGNQFELALKQVLGAAIFDRMTNAGPYDWETQIRQAYCSSSGLSLGEVFPGYLEQSPQLKGVP